MPKLIELATCQYERFRALWDWAESLGACLNCSIMSACAVTQREAGNKLWGAPPTERCTNKHLGVEYCLNLVRTNWKDSPKK